MYGVDSEWVIEFINPTALDLLSHTYANDLIGHLAFDAFHYADENRKPMQRGFASESVRLIARSSPR